jgi:hypothetical protein
VAPAAFDGARVQAFVPIPDGKRLRDTSRDRETLRSRGR